MKIINSLSWIENLLTLTHSILLYVAIILSSSWIYGQTDSTKISFIAYWNKGDTYDFTVTKVKRDWDEEKLIKNDTTRYTANFHVLDSTPTSYTISWKYTQSIISPLNNALGKMPEARQALDSVIEKYGVTDIIYHTDELGEFREVQNWKEISKLVSGIFEEMVNQAIKKSPDKKEKLVRAFEPFKNMFATKEGVESYLISEILFIHTPFGYEYDIENGLTYEQEYPDVLGVGPMKSNVSIHFEDVDFENYTCTLYEDVKVDPELAKTAIRNMLMKMGMEGAKLEESLEGAELSISDSNYYQYYFDPGVPHKIYGSRNIKLKMPESNLAKSEELIIELIYEE